jgi:hypothetical protein
MSLKNTDGVLPPKVEKRLSDLIAMGEFSTPEADFCRRTYWHRFADGAEQRHEWHQILINCFDRAQKRIGAAA